MELKPDKGVKGGSCNVTACQKPGAMYYNKSTKKYTAASVHVKSIGRAAGLIVRSCTARICCANWIKKESNMLDKHTFGDAPAAIFLADRLNMLNNAKFTRKISARIHESQTMLAEAIKAHDLGAISTHTLSFMTFALEEKIDSSAKSLMTEGTYFDSKELPDLLAVNLMLNVIKGGLKRARHQSQMVKHLESKQQSMIDTKRPITKNNHLFVDNVLVARQIMIPVKIQLSQIHETITSASLQVKSRKKLTGKGKKCELY
jgi:hypothetical protein